MKGAFERSEARVRGSGRLELESTMATVSIVSESVAALDQPNFIIKVVKPGLTHPVYYVTMAVWEYDKNIAEPGDETRGCDSVADFFENRPPAGRLDAFERPAGVAAGSLGIGTGPPRGPGPGPAPGLTR